MNAINNRRRYFVSSVCALSLLMVGASGCGGGSSSGGTGGGGGTTCGAGGAGTPAASAPLAGACTLDTHVGQFALSLLPATATAVAASQFAGSVYDLVDPSTVWTAKMTVGSCSVLTGPAYNCSATKCVSPQICVAQDTCGPSRSLQDTGTVSLAGLGCSRSEAYQKNSGYFDGLAGIAYPPVSAGAGVAIGAAGGVLAPFTLNGEGVEPLQFDGSALTLTGGQDLTVTWTPPAQAGGMQKIKITIDAAHHGGTAARLECDGLPDTGTTIIDGGLIAFLVSKGVAGFPTIDVSRRTADSTTVASGCVDFLVQSTVSSPLAVCSAGVCVQSCNCGGSSGGACKGGVSDVPCATGTICQADFTCK